MISTDARVVLFESPLRENFYPLTHTKLACDLFFGTSTLLESIANKLNKVTDLYVPRYIESYAREVHPGVGVNNENSDQAIILNSLVSQKPEFWSFALNVLNGEEVLYEDQSGNFVFGFLKEFSPELLSKSIKARSKIKTKRLPEDVDAASLIRYPWELVRDNSDKIASDFSGSTFSLSKSADAEIRGERLSIAESADVEKYVTFDTRKGPIIIEDDVEIQSFSHIIGPCFVGNGSKVRSARLREGTSIGPHCKVAGEVEASIVCERSNKSHEGFLGHSIVGSWVNLGAQTSNSDLKNTYGKVSVKMGRKLVDTGQIKVGVFLGDMSKTAIGTLLTTGIKVGVGSQVLGTVTEDVPAFTMYAKSLRAKSVEIFMDSAILTQKRMMERRGLKMTSAMELTIRSVYKMTKGERAFQRVAKSRFKIP